MGFKDDNYATPTHRGHNPYLQEALNKLSDMKQETLEEAAERYIEDSSHALYELRKECFLDGAKWQQERMFSEEDMKNAFDSARETIPHPDWDFIFEDFTKWFEQFKKK